MEFKKYKPEYLRRVINLLNTCFPEKKISQKSFIWKHHDKFFNEKTISMVATSGKKVCALVCFTPIKIKKNDKIYNFYSCAVQATHPLFRRRGIISKLTQLIEAELGPQMNYLGFSNEAGVQIDKFSKRINYSIVGQLATQYIPAMLYQTKFQTTETDLIEKQFVAKSDSRFLSIHKDLKYLDWRYAQNPVKKYHYLKIWQNNKIIAYIIFNEEKIKLSIREIIFAKNTKFKKEILKIFSNYAFSRGKSLVSCTYLQNNFWKNCFPKFSYKKTISMYFTVKTTNAQFLNADNWLIQGGDIQ